jgi:hypothetical protein
MATAECIHGFEPGFCDSCYPREQAVPLRTTTRIAQAKRSATLGSRTPPSSPRNRTIAPSVLLAAQRIYHVTHLDNLALIASERSLRSRVTPAVDVSSLTTRELRDSVELPGSGLDRDPGDHDTVGSRVPFYLSPHANRWLELRAGANGIHWSEAARSIPATEYVVLVSEAAAIGPELVLADSDAAAPATRFAYGLEAGTSQLRRMHAIDDEYRDAELLAPSPFPFDSITLIGVANEPMRDRVKQVLVDAGGPLPRVAVYPPWFAPES